MRVFCANWALLAGEPNQKNGEEEYLNGANPGTFSSRRLTGSVL